MRGGLRVEEASGDRWHLALDLIENGTESVVVGDDLEIRRHVGWPGADGRIHLGVLATEMPPCSQEASHFTSMTHEDGSPTSSQMTRDEACRDAGTSFWIREGDSTRPPRTGG
jgi:hypothetical protein